MEPFTEPLTRREKRKMQKLLQHRQNERRKNFKTFAICLMALAFAAFIGFKIFTGLQQSDASNDRGGNNGTPQIQVDPSEYNAGTVSMKDGLVKYSYEVRNNGTGDLRIVDIWTSCHCTTAILRTGDKKSPKFGMDRRLTPWSQTIKPGETGYLDVEFDPAFHGPMGIGYAVREIYLSTNDPKAETASIKLTADVTT